LKPSGVVRAPSPRRSAPPARALGDARLREAEAQDRGGGSCDPQVARSVERIERDAAEAQPRKAPKPTWKPRSSRAGSEEAIRRRGHHHDCETGGGTAALEPRETRPRPPAPGAAGRRAAGAQRSRAAGASRGRLTVVTALRAGEVRAFVASFRRRSGVTEGHAADEPKENSCAK
jgi:hypothetical protein